MNLLRCDSHPYRSLDLTGSKTRRSVRGWDLTFLAQVLAASKDLAHVHIALDELWHSARAKSRQHLSLSLTALGLAPVPSAIRRYLLLTVGQIAAKLALRRREAGRVGPDQNLGVAVRPGRDAEGGNPQVGGNGCGGVRGTISIALTKAPASSRALASASSPLMAVSLRPWIL